MFIDKRQTKKQQLENVKQLELQIHSKSKPEFSSVVISNTAQTSQSPESHQSPQP